MSKIPSPQSGPADVEVPWSEEWIPLKDVVQHDPWQVRWQLDDGTVKRYQTMTEAGSTPPPIKVARIPDGRLLLVDGWHRMKARALRFDELQPEMICALVAPLSPNEAQWQAARANMGHGLQLKAAELREVFRAFIKAGMHKGPRGVLLSYREIAPHVGKKHTTIRNWMIADFPAIARKMGGTEQGNKDGAQPPTAALSLAEEQCEEVIRMASGAMGALPQLTSHQRFQLVEAVRALITEAERLGIEAPPPEDF